MPLPGLGKFMASKGLLGSPPPTDEEGGGKDEEAGSEDDELSSCIDDVAEAVSSGDKGAIVSALHALVDCLKEEDVQQDDNEE